MTLAQLRYAITVAGASSMNEAARKLFISQPSLSVYFKRKHKEEVWGFHATLHVCGKGFCGNGQAVRYG